MLPWSHWSWGKLGVSDRSVWARSSSLLATPLPQLQVTPHTPCTHSCTHSLPSGQGQKSSPVESLKENINLSPQGTPSYSGVVGVVQTLQNNAFSFAFSVFFLQLLQRGFWRSKYPSKITGVPLFRMQLPKMPSKRQGEFNLPQEKGDISFTEVKANLKFPEAGTTSDSVPVHCEQLCLYARPLHLRPAASRLTHSILLFGGRS